jgi:hypothetical protein
MAFDAVVDLIANRIVLGIDNATLPRLEVGAVRDAGNLLAVLNGYEHMVLAVESGFIRGCG